MYIPPFFLLSFFPASICCLLSSPLFFFISFLPSLFYSSFFPISLMSLLFITLKYCSHHPILSSFISFLLTDIFHFSFYKLLLTFPLPQPYFFFLSSASFQLFPFYLTFRFFSLFYSLTSPSFLYPSIPSCKPLFYSLSFLPTSFLIRSHPFSIQFSFPSLKIPSHPSFIQFSFSSLKIPRHPSFIRLYFPSLKNLSRCFFS